MMRIPVKMAFFISNINTIHILYILFPSHNFHTFVSKVEYDRWRITLYYVVYSGRPRTIGKTKLPGKSSATNENPRSRTSTPAYIPNSLSPDDSNREVPSLSITTVGKLLQPRPCSPFAPSSEPPWPSANSSPQSPAAASPGLLRFVHFRI